MSEGKGFYIRELQRKLKMTLKRQEEALASTKAQLAEIEELAGDKEQLELKPKK